MKLTIDEKILKFLIYNNKTRKDNTAIISSNDVMKIGLSEKEIIKSLYKLEADGYLTFSQKSQHDKFDIFWKMVLTSSGLNYFENKKYESKLNKRDWVKTYLPITISILALLKSFSSELLLLWEQVLKLIEQLLRI